MTASARGQTLYTAVAGPGAALFFLGPPLALLAGVHGLIAATAGYAGIALFTGGVAARYSFAVAERPALQLLKNLAIGTAVSGVFYLIFLFLYLI